MAAGAASAQLTINGAGATFPYPIYSKWFDAYTRVDPSVRFNYQSIGSGGGQKQITGRTVDFGATDCPMTDESLKHALGRLLHIPTVAGAVAICYHLPGVSQLNLDGDTIGQIYLGRITRWDDPAIAKLNPGQKLPAMPIVVVHRSDGSGTTYIWTDFLCAASKRWKEMAGKGTSVRWPAGVGAKGNEGVAGQVKQLPGAIGYVELVYALQTHTSTAAVQNRAGAFILPSVESISAALERAEVPEDFRCSIANAEGEKAYPIAGLTWFLVYQQQSDAVKGRKLVEFLRWMVSDGEKMANDLHYAPLPEALEQRVLAEVASIKY